MANSQKSGKISKRMQKRAQERAKKRRNLLIIIAVAILVVAAGAAVIWSNSANQTAQTGLPLEVSIEEAYQMVDEGAFLLDVRTQGEWDEFHAPMAKLIPLDQLEARINEVPTDREVVVICRSGNRSQVGRDILLDAGHPSVTSAAGGMNAWAGAGFPTE